MSFNKDRVMQELQRFGGAMYTPVILFAFFGLTVALSIIFSNTGLFGSLAEKGTLWYDFWYVVQQGAWTVFNQMPILFAIAVPIGFAKKEQARCAMEGFVIYMVFNYFIAGILTLHGSYFGVDYSQNAGAGTGLAMIANIKTLDMGMLGAIFIACISACRATSAAASSTASSRTGSPCSAIMPGPTFCRLPLASALRPFTSSSSASSSFTSICPRRAVPMMAAKTNCSPKRNTKPRKKWKRKALPAVPMP